MIQIRTMLQSDIDDGMRLKEQAGWNQVAADWRRLLDLQPDGGWVAELHGQVVGTVTTSRFGRVAWIAMMLVDVNLRSRGIGRALMTRALEHLEEHAVESVRLDATPQGRPLYESLGFVPETIFHRYSGVLPATDSAVELPTWPSEGRIDELIALDRAVTKTERGALISRLVTEHAESLRVAEDDRGGVAGFLLARPGAHARQIGPCLASATVGGRLLADAARRYAGEAVCLDIPTAHEEARALVRTWALSPTRELLRMGRGPRVAEDLSRLWASAGPEKG